MNMNAAEKNAFESLAMLLQLSKVRVTRNTVREKLWQHPDFPSLVSLSDALDELNVSNMATRLTPEQLPSIPLPALAYLEIDGGIFVLIRTIAADKVEWLHTKRGWQKQTLSDFSRIWNGVTLLIEANQQSGEANFTEQRKKHWIENSRYPFIIVGLLVCFGLFLTYSFQHTTLAANGQLYGLLGLKFAGIVISSLLIAYTLNADSPFLRSICQLNNRTNCNSILQSKAANVFDWLSWSEIGLLYFSGGFIALTLSLTIPTLSGVQVLVWLNLLALPYTIYSIYYQAVIAKEFCVLCIITQILLWAEFLVGHTLLEEISKQGIVLCFFSFLLAGTIWAFIKNPISSVPQIAPLQRELYKLKFNPEYIETLFNKQPTMPPIFESMEVVTLGDPDAIHTITMVTNPMCRSCAIAHKKLENLLETTNNINCNVVFTLPDTSAVIVGEMIMSTSIENRAYVLHNWFNREDRNFSKWGKTISSVNLKDEVNQQLILHRRWCELGRILRTPTIFLDGVELPTLYRIDDVAHLYKTLSLQIQLLST